MHGAWLIEDILTAIQYTNGAPNLISIEMASAPADEIDHGCARRECAGSAVNFTCPPAPRSARFLSEQTTTVSSRQGR